MLSKGLIAWNGQPSKPISPGNWWGIEAQHRGSGKWFPPLLPLAKSSHTEQWPQVRPNMSKCHFMQLQYLTGLLHRNPLGQQSIIQWNVGWCSASPHPSPSTKTLASSSSGEMVGGLMLKPSLPCPHFCAHQEESTQIQVSSACRSRGHDPFQGIYFKQQLEFLLYFTYSCILCATKIKMEMIS